MPYVPPYPRRMRKTSVYLSDDQAQRLARLASQEGRSQAEILRDAVDRYQPPGRPDRDFALAAGFPRVDADRRPIAEIPDAELLAGFGA
jgi:predicted DNA-binding protein